MSWSEAPFAELKALPDKGKSVDKWRNKDSAWRNVADGIEKVAGELRRRKRYALKERSLAKTPLIARKKKKILALTKP